MSGPASPSPLGGAPPERRAPPNGDGEPDTLRDAKLAAMAEFCAGAGHEINNPAAAIHGRCSLLLRNCDDPALARELRVISEQALRIRDMIADALLFARPPGAGPGTALAASNGGGSARRPVRTSGGRRLPDRNGSRPGRARSRPGSTRRRRRCARPERDRSRGEPRAVPRAPPERPGTPVRLRRRPRVLGAGPRARLRPVLQRPAGGAGVGVRVAEVLAHRHGARRHAAGAEPAGRDGVPRRPAGAARGLIARRFAPPISRPRMSLSFPAPVRWAGAGGARPPARRAGLRAERAGGRSARRGSRGGGRGGSRIAPRPGLPLGGERRPRSPLALPRAAGGGDPVGGRAEGGGHGAGPRPVRRGGRAGLRAGSGGGGVGLDRAAGRLHQHAGRFRRAGGGGRLPRPDGPLHPAAGRRGGRDEPQRGDAGAGRSDRRRGDDPHPRPGHRLGAGVPDLLRRLLQHAAAGRHDPPADGPAEGQPRETGVPGRLHRRPGRRAGADLHLGRRGDELHLRGVREDRGRRGGVRRLPGDGPVPVLPDLPAGLRGGGGVHRAGLRADVEGRAPGRLRGRGAQAGVGGHRQRGDPRGGGRPPRGP